MTSTRSAGARKKRNLTAASVDLLNGVMNKKGKVVEERQTQSARPVRQLRNISRAPQRDIWEIPVSPEHAREPISKSSPLATAQPQTPRRSTRIQGQPQVQYSSIGETHGVGRAGVEQTDNEEVGESRQSTHEGSHGESSDDVEGSNRLENADNELIGNFNFFSDDANSHRSSSPDFPSPSALLNQDLERFSQFESTLSNAGTPKRVKEVRSTDKRTSRSPSQAYRSNPEATVPGPAVVIQGSPSKVLETPIQREQRLPSHSPRARAKDVDGGVQMTEDDHEATSASDDTGSVFEASNRLSSDFSMPVGQNRSPVPATRSGQLRQSADAHALRSGESAMVPRASTASSSSESIVSASSRPSATAIPSPSWQSPDNPTLQRRDPSIRLVDSAERVEPNQARANRPRRNRSSRPTHYASESPVPESHYPRCKEAMEVGQQQENWKTLIDEAYAMKQKANSTVEGHLQDIIDVILHLQQSYEDLCQGSGFSQSFSSKDARNCERVLDNISREGDQILDHIYHLVVHSKGSRKKKGLGIFKQFEARVIPATIQLIFAIFDAYHTNSDRFSDAYYHLHRALTLLLWFCDRVRSLRVERYVECSTRSQNLRYPLQKLIEASKSDNLRRAEPDSSDQSGEVIELDDDDDGDSDDDDDFPPSSTQRQWADAEGHALINGLKQYQGANRYILISRNFGDKLGGRMIHELREKAREIYTQVVPSIQDLLHTQGGREEWHWLLSVNE
ncbi:hypothetical protein BDW59DRAFT_58527 [Aspergillus cavernicola]|uniref:Uncharacterized protein n=1 Tax=Aspergillus cavernicola TaxID=176166 RepID=A0ABR4IHJ2_9EURO